MKFVKQGKDLGLDYIMNLPKKVHEKLSQSVEQNLKRSLRSSGQNENDYTM